MLFEVEANTKVYVEYAQRRLDTDTPAASPFDSRYAPPTSVIRQPPRFTALMGYARLERGFQMVSMKS